MTKRFDAKDYKRLVRGVSNNKAQPVRNTEGYFGSKGEYRRWCELKLMQQGRMISNLSRQYRFDIVVGTVHIKTYTADFVYLERGRWVMEDFKGRRYREWILTKKLLTALYPDWVILETGSSKKPKGKK